MVSESVIILEAEIQILVRQSLLGPVVFQHVRLYKLSTHIVLYDESVSGLPGWYVCVYSGRFLQRRPSLRLNRLVVK